MEPPPRVMSQLGPDSTSNLFKGTFFSTGGYQQNMDSAFFALALNTQRFGYPVVRRLELIMSGWREVIHTLLAN